MLELAKRIGLSDNTLIKLERVISESSEKIDKIAVKCAEQGFFCLKNKTRIFNLAVILKCAVNVKEKYDSFGIDDKIYYDTMSDIKIWCDKTGGEGIKNYGWLKNHVSFELFRIGRLQFQLFECKNKTLNYKKLPFSYGDKLVYVHIPEGEKLEKEKCEASLSDAVSFFARYFPDFQFDYFFCESWLLFEGNKSFMNENSNILSFMSLFNCCYSVKIDEQAIERIFGKRCLFKKNYPEKTSLQRQTKRYMLEGNRPGIGIGVIEKSQYL